MNDKSQYCELSVNQKHQSIERFGKVSLYFNKAHFKDIMWNG